jgi:hypothetical protein
LGLSAGDKEEGGTKGDDEEEEASGPTEVSDGTWSNMLPGGRESSDNGNESVEEEIIGEEIIGDLHRGLELLLDAGGLGNEIEIRDDGSLAYAAKVSGRGGRSDNWAGDIVSYSYGTDSGGGECEVEATGSGSEAP